MKKISVEIITTTELNGLALSKYAALVHEGSGKRVLAVGGNAASVKKEALKLTAKEVSLIRPILEEDIKEVVQKTLNLAVCTPVATDKGKEAVEMIKKTAEGEFLERTLFQHLTDLKFWLVTLAKECGGLGSEGVQALTQINGLLAVIL